MGLHIAVINNTGGGMSGGYRTYLHNVLPRLAAYSDVEAILCATPGSVESELWFPPLPKVQFVPCQPFRFLRHWPDCALGQAVSRFAPDVIFIPVERYLNFGNVPVITMVQNMGPFLAFSENPLSERLRYMAQRYETKVAVQKAAKVIVPTNFVRDFLIKKWNISPERVRTIYYGPGSPEEVVQPRKPTVVPEKWIGKFLFTFGSIEPYRGLEDIAHALGQLRLNGKLRGLVIAGVARGNMKGYQHKLIQWVNRHNLISYVRWTGQLNKEEAAWCYRNCRAFVMTSRVESFGVIGLEALAHGCICIVANNPPFPEIFDNSALYYTPRNSSDLANKIGKMLDWNDIRRQHASTVARDRASQFSWDDNIQALVSVFKEVIQKNRPRPEVGHGIA